MHAILEHGAKRVCVDLEDVVEAHDLRIHQRFVDIVPTNRKSEIGSDTIRRRILPDRVLEIVLLLLIVPVRIKLVNLAGHFAVIGQVKCLIDLAI